ncbi:MAG: hypothetical protein ABSF79_03365 [Smithellaceae bacterium]|jgi:hypothetical protein
MIDKLETEIASILEGVMVADKQAGVISDREWTRRIKEGLCNLGKQKGYGVSAAGCAGADTGEWLFDLVWATVQDDQFLQMPLVMECEWNPNFDEIDWDFEKLLIAKADHKLMIFQQAIESDVRDVMKKLKAMVSSFKTSFQGERYLLAGYAFDEHKFFYEVI